LLLLPNGRYPLPDNNGIGYGTHIKSHFDGNNSPFTSNPSREIPSQPIVSDHDYGYVYHANNHLDMMSLNNVFNSLLKNMEIIYNMIHAICLPPNNNSISHLLIRNNNNE